MSALRTSALRAGASSVPALRMGTLGTVKEVARMEFAGALRASWLRWMVALFAVTAIAMSYAGSLASGVPGFQGFSRTSVSLINLVLLIVPSLALVLGISGFVGRPGYWELLLAQGMTRQAVLAGKYIGYLAALWLSLLGGVSAVGVVFALVAGANAWSQLALLAVEGAAAIAAYLSVAALVAVVTRDQSKALIAGVAVWFLSVIVYDLAVASIAVALPAPANVWALVGLVLGNPADMIRTAFFVGVGVSDSLGPTGAALGHFLGSKGSFYLLNVGVALWSAACLAVAMRISRRWEF